MFGFTGVLLDTGIQIRKDEYKTKGSMTIQLNKIKSKFRWYYTFRIDKYGFLPLLNPKIPDILRNKLIVKQEEYEKRLKAAYGR